MSALQTNLLETIPGLGPLGHDLGVGGHRWENLLHSGSFFNKPPQKTGLGREYDAIESAANRYHIDPVLLWGVFGAETAHGSDIKPSSTGAQGPFQFEPATAREYGYPLNKNTTGITDWTAFQQQANAAAHYLSSLLPGGKGEAGLKRGAQWEEAWDKAIRAYSGGGYGLQHVIEEGKSAMKVRGNESQQANQYAREESEESVSIWQQLLNLGAKLVFLLIGALLMIYGIMVALRPPERALSLRP